MKAKKGVLLINLGTPDSPKVSDVKKYLDEFLMDGRVIDIGQFQRNLLVRGIIVPFRSPKTAKLYEAIWDKEHGSPLLYYSLRQLELLRKELGPDYQVELAMRYQQPSIEEALEKFKANLIESIVIFPLFPQYASATTGSVMEKVMRLMSKWNTFPQLSFVNQFYDNEQMIEAFAENGKRKDPTKFDHFLFSFHGLPMRQLKNVDNSGNHGCAATDCCQKITESNKFCYSAQCHATARLIAERLNIPKEDYTVCFQSRLGKEPWIQPYTSEVLKDVAARGKKSLLVFSPAFVADCLETLYEITEEYGTEFRALGGESVELVPSLNENPKWISAMRDLVHAHEPHTDVLV
ncbi:ferrochelatase [Olivibacter sitiensis]|uniref:ferrochelatase n=1 Tax=Olivibacter sitiensis TaxID=376470 RepID=UPI000427D109|nr:ferrochelatase [Olivibacter sitiensis]